MDWNKKIPGLFEKFPDENKNNRDKKRKRPVPGRCCLLIWQGGGGKQFCTTHDMSSKYRKRGFVNRRLPPGRNSHFRLTTNDTNGFAPPWFFYLVSAFFLVCTQTEIGKPKYEFVGLAVFVSVHRLSTTDRRFDVRFVVK
jgi:hypothetical protein